MNKAHVLVLALAVTACGGSGKQSTLDNKHPMVVRDDLSLLPVDSELVIGINFAQVQQSPLWQKFVVPALGQGDLGQAQAKFKQLCNFDALAETKSIAVGAKHLNSGAAEIVMVVHGLMRDKVTACLNNPNVAAEASKEHLELRHDGDVTIMHDTNKPNAVALQFLDGETLLAYASKNPTKADLQALQTSQTTLKTSPAFTELYGMIDTKASLWGLANGASGLLDKLAEVGMKPKAVFGTLNVTDRLAADVRMRLDTPDQATQIAAGLKQQVQMIQGFVDSLDVSSDGADVHLAVAMSEQKIMGLSQMMGN